MSYQNRVEALRDRLMGTRLVQDVENIGRRALSALNIRDESEARKMLGDYGVAPAKDAPLHDIAMAAAMLSRSSVMGAIRNTPACFAMRMKTTKFTDAIVETADQMGGSPWVLLLRKQDEYLMAQPIYQLPQPVGDRLTDAELFQLDHAVRVLPIRMHGCIGVALSDLKKGMRALARMMNDNDHDDTGNGDEA